MKNLLLVIRNGAFAVAVAAALSLGAAEGLSGSPDATPRRDDCTFPDYCDDDDYCNDVICAYPPYYGGTCNLHWNCCICFE
jgi:hypothetical protein